MNRTATGLRRISLLVVLSASIVKASAQTITPRVGLTLSKTSRNVSNTAYHDYSVDFRQGFLVGVAYEYPLRNRFSVQGEITYIQKGQKTTQESVDPSIAYKDNRNYFLTYLELPLILKYNMGSGKIKFSPHIGISVGYGLSGNVTYLFVHQTSAGEVISENYKEEIAFKKSDQWGNSHNGTLSIGGPIDIAVQAGIGVLFFNKVVLDVRYSEGLKGYEFFYQDSDANRVLQFSVGFPIRLRQSG